MDFLQDDERATLEAALAFVDSCEDDDDGPHDIGITNQSEGSLDSTSSNNSTATIEHASQRPKVMHRKQGIATRKHQGMPTVASRVRKRVAVEILELRGHVSQLTARLDLLQSRRAIAPSRANALQAQRPENGLESALHAKECSRTRDDAMTALQMLHASNAVNQKLRVAWKKQIKLAKRLETRIMKMLTPMDLGAIDTPKRKQMTHAFCDNVPKARANVHIFAELHQYLDSVYHETESISASISIDQDTSRVSSSSHVHHDPLLGDIFECSTNMPLECGLRDLDAHVQSLLSSEKAMRKKPSIVNYVTRTLPNQPRVSREHQFTQNFDCQFGDILVSGVSVSHKYEEPHRRVLAYTSLLALEGTDLTFRETGWLLLTERSDRPDGPRSSLMQGYYRVHLEETSSSEASSSPCTYFQNFVLHSQSEEMRTKQLHLQAAVLQKFGPA